MKITNFISFLTFVAFTSGTIYGCATPSTAPTQKNKPSTTNIGNGGLSIMSTDNPQLKKEIDALKGLSKENKKAKIEELKKKYPNSFKKNGYKGAQVSEKTKNIQLTGKSDSLKTMYSDALGNKLEKKKDNLALLKEFQSLKGLSKAAKKTKLEQIKKKYPDAFKNKKRLVNKLR